MPLQRVSEIKVVEFKYTGADGDIWDITFFDSNDRRYIKIQKEGDEFCHNWDVQMLLDLANSVQNIINPYISKSQEAFPSLLKPTVFDHRELPTPNDLKIGEELGSAPAESLQADIEQRIKTPAISNSAAKIRKVGASDLV